MSVTKNNLKSAQVHPNKMSNNKEEDLRKRMEKLKTTSISKNLMRSNSKSPSNTPSTAKLSVKRKVKKGLNNTTVTSHFCPLFPISVIEELQKTIYELKLECAIQDTTANIESIRRKMLMEEILSISSQEELQELKLRLSKS